MGLVVWNLFPYLICPVAVLMRNFGGMGVYLFHSHCWEVFLPLCREMLVLLLVFDLG